MATNLNPGADATLVSVAYRAAMANTPGDYSGTLENTAASYERTMQASSKMFGNFAKLGAAIGGEMMANANELSAYAAKGAGLNPEDAELFMKEIYGNKDAQKELGLFGGRFGDRETRQRRQELKMEQQKLFADIDLAAESIATGAEAVGAGLFDASLNETEAEMVNAIIKSNLKDKVTENGNMAKLTRDEKTGELMYTMYKEGGEVSMLNGEPQTMTVSEFNKSITTNVDDKGAMQGLFNTLNDGEAKAGNQSLNGVYDPQRKQMTLNKLDTMLQTSTDLRRAMKTKFGYSNTSFFDDIQNPSTLSANLYSTLLTVTGDGNELALGGVTEGIEDIDGSGGISKAELTNATNYGILSANILGMKDPEVSKAYFKEYTTNKMEEAYKYGYSKKPPVAGSGVAGDDKDVKYGGWGRDNWTTKGTKDQGGAYITWIDAESRRNDLNAFRDVGGKHGYYTWNENLGKNGMYVDERGDEFTMYNVADREGLIMTGEGKGDFNPTRNAAANKENKNLNKGLASPSMLKDISNDDTAAEKLNNTFKFTSAKDSDYFFVPYSDVYGEIVGADNVFSNDIMLIDGSTGKPIRDGKKVRRFSTGKDYNANDLKWINDFLGEYAGKQQQADDTTTYTQN